MALVACEKIPTFDKITDYLFLGDIEAAKSEKCLQNIDIVVNISGSEYEPKEGIIYYNFDIQDDRNEQISIYFDDFKKIVDEAKQKDKKVLVHCMNSVSRSVTLVLYYIMKHFGTSLKDSINFLKSKRENQYTRPNIGFFKQLLKVEKELGFVRSMTFRDL